MSRQHLTWAQRLEWEESPGNWGNEHKEEERVAGSLRAGKTHSAARLHAATGLPGQKLETGLLLAVILLVPSQKKWHF
jgi:hypothetical protein